jgi:hypothetical protein
MTIAFVLLIVELLVPAVRRLYRRWACAKRLGRRARRFGGSAQDD